MIINIPFIKTKTTEKEDYNNMRLLCLPVKRNLSFPFLFLLKKSNSFELVVRDTQTSWSQSKLQLKKNVKSIISFTFNYNKENTPKNNIVNFFIEYYNSSCIKENKYPDNFNYTELYDVSTLLSIIKNTPHDIYFQIVNSFNKVIMIVTKRGLIIPVKESILIDKIQKINLETFIEKNKAVDINKLEKLIDEFNNLPKTTFKMSIKGVVQKKYTKSKSDTEISLKDLEKTLDEIATNITVPNIDINRKNRNDLFNIECEQQLEYIDTNTNPKEHLSLLNKYNFNLEKIKGDGNCQYRAVAKIIYGDSDLYKKVKNEMKKELELLYKNSKEFFEYSVDDYMKDEFWGDHITLIALSNTFKDYCFNVYTLCKKNDQIFLSGTRIIENCDRRFDCNLLYTGENHYDALL